MATLDRVILVDGSALIYRAYYAIPAHLTTAQGLHTNAIYGFATMFRKMLAGRRPSYGAVVFDAPGKTFRDERYPLYKAQRPRMPDDLREQLPSIDRLVAAHRFPLLRVPGFEADDVIGTLARQAVEGEMEVFIVSGDKDFAQLIDDRVRMVDTLRDVTYDPELVRKKWGVAPESFVDLLALVGDKSDNIPGVPGIGQKGAAQLLERFGNLDAVLAATEQLTGRQRSALEEHADQARLSRELATIDRHVPLDVGVADLRLEVPDGVDLDAIYKELEFFSLLSGDAAGADPGEDDAEYTTLEREDAVVAWLAALPAETPVAVFPVVDPPGPVHGALAGLALAHEPGRACYLPLAGASSLGAGALERLRPWLENADRPKLAYNAKALWIALDRAGVTLRGVVGDVLLESFLVEPTKLIPHRLSQIAKEYLQRIMQPAKAVLGAGRAAKPFTEAGLEAVAPWACQRADVVRSAWPAVRERLEAEGQRDNLFEIDLPLAWVLGRMEVAGIAVDPDDLARMGEEFGGRLETIAATIYDLAGRRFNIDSPKQLSEVLFDELGLPVIKRTKSGYSTNAEVLERLATEHEIARHVLAYRKLAKLINTYTDVLQRAVHPSTGRIHATFQQTVGATGRLITTDPDLQRTPIKTPDGKRIRQTFVAAPGCRLISADWSQIELRLLAHFTGDPLLVEAFARGHDVHRKTAGQLFGVAEGEVTSEQRGVGKLVNFSTIYGQGATALGQILGVPRKQAQRYIDGYFVAYRGVREWLDRTIEQAHEDGFVTTLRGRRRYIPELRSRSFMDRQAGERIAANTPIQGSAADLCKLAMLAIDRRLRASAPGTRMLLQIHDELVFEAPEAEVEQVAAIVRAEMEGVYGLRVPLEVEVGVGRTWAEAH